jgi:glycosyltransferase involved in cell wall biosynthesis
VVGPRAGRLGAVGDVDGMAAAGIELLADSEMWRRASEAARADAERFSASRVVPEYEAFYEEVLAR